VKTEEKGRELCIIFSRYPRPGASKTRLIPRLGPQGAAELQRRMTEQVVAAAGRLASGRRLRVELAMADAGPQEMAAWLGRGVAWQPQQGADLGERMAHAFAQAFERGFQRVVLVGADCPSLDVAVLARAFQALGRHELVLGPAGDGGYYLIGLNRPCPALFSGIAWGSHQVLAQTLAAAARAALVTALLERLPDVDRPADLAALPPALVEGLL
jgi:hypothetical protein